jgi:DNA-binding transcriptional ArsR family regulator
MVTVTSTAEIATLIGNPTRMAMLQALMDGRALTATELSLRAGVTPQTTSGHLARLAQANLIVVVKQGRHRYHRLASPEIGRLLESLMFLASTAEPPSAHSRVGPRDPSLRLARTCSDHIAGQLGVAIADAFIARGWIEVAEDVGVVTGSGSERLRAIGIDAAAISQGRTGSVCRMCLDWSERRFHIGGRLGAVICMHGMERGWVRRRAGSRDSICLTRGGGGGRKRSTWRCPFDVGSWRWSTDEQFGP